MAGNSKPCKLYTVDFRRQTLRKLWRDSLYCAALLHHTHIFFQVESAVVQQGLDHPHEVDEQRQVVLHHVDLDALRHKHDEAGQHLV